jgi:isoleucyl-tRNA synthetase
LYKPVSPEVDFPALERDVLGFWDERQTFQKLVERNRGNARWSFIDGPITANNPMGVHHAWGRTYKDVYQRYHAMKGFDQRYQNGFDCQGLWVEVEVEKELGLNSKRQIEEYGLDRFAEKCRERVLKYASVITEQSKRLGMWNDWDHSYYTMDDNNIEHIWHFLQVCNERGWLYKGWRTMPWCIRCGTSLSQHELVGTDSYRDVVHPSVFFRVPIVGHDDAYFLVWTTTPWTLSANVALAVHPELDYAQVEAGEDTYYLSAKTLDALHTPHQVVRTLKGSDLVGWLYRGPFDELPAQAEVAHRVVPWADVGEDEGTGIVHIAPGCGAEDFALAQEHGLPVLVPIDENGTYPAEYGVLAGMNVRHVNDTVFDSLREKGMLHRVAEIEHRYPTCWRCGEQIVFRGVSEWFISADEIRPRMIAAARTVAWTPPSAGKRMEDWLNNMGDWCISRKRYWGLPLPFYPCSACNTMTIVGSMDELRELAVSGMEEVRELHRPWIDAVKIRCPQCGETAERVTEVGDCWLDAGIVPFSTLGPGALKDPEEWARWFPADWVSEMREQIRLWFYSMLFMSVALEDRAPYKAVLVYEKLMDENGRPMHKSLGNAIWFEEAAERMGADVMRWLYAGQSLTSNLLFGYGPAEEVRRKLLTLWNVYRFFVTNAEVEHFDPTAPSLHGERTKLDHWIISQLEQLVQLADAELSTFDLAAVRDGVDRFVDDLSNWYLRRNRRRFSRAAEPADRDAAFRTLHECLVTLARLTAPIMPFLAEEMYGNLVRSTDEDALESVHLTPYPTADASRIDASLDEEMALAREVVTLGRAARSDAQIRVRQPLPAITIASGAGAELALSHELRSEIADELNVQRVEIAHNVEEFARRVVRANPRVLGPRLGAKFPAVNRALQNGEYRLNQDGTVSVDGEVLGADEVSVSLQPLENRALAQDLQWQGGIAVALDGTVTPELRAEGLAREFVHRVQTLRRDAGLRVEDRIALAYRAPSELAEIIEARADQIRADVGADRIAQLDGADTPEDATIWQGILEGYDLLIAIDRMG